MQCMLCACNNDCDLAQSRDDLIRSSGAGFHRAFRITLSVDGSVFAAELDAVLRFSFHAGKFDTCNRLCQQVHGHHRGGELGNAIAKSSATVVEHDRQITGYATVIGFFGHAVGETNKDLKALIGAAKEFAGPGFLLPTRNGELFRWCLSNGLRIAQPMTLMSKGLFNEPAGAFLPSISY